MLALKTAGGKMAPTALPEWSAETNPYVICIFTINKEGFNGFSSIKTDIYFALELCGALPVPFYDM